MEVIFDKKVTVYKDMDSNTPVLTELAPGDGAELGKSTKKEGRNR